MRVALVAAMVIASACGAPAPPTALSLHPARCAAASADAPPLVSTAVTVPMLGNPFDVVMSADGQWAFAALAEGRIAVLTADGDGFTTTRVLLLPGRPELSGLALTHDGRYLLAADGDDGIIVLDVALATRQELAPIVAHLHGPRSDEGAIVVATSLDDRLAFVSMEKSGGVAVYDLRAALASGADGGLLLGVIPTGLAPVGLALSPDGRWLYATSELASRDASTGTLSVIDVAVAASRPVEAVVASVAAGCGPVRVAASPDGSVVWVTARESNAVLAFSSAALLRDPTRALITTVPVGQAPVALALTADGKMLLVADSDRFAHRDFDLRAINVESALGGKAATLGSLPMSAFPRALAVDERGDRVLVADFDASVLQVVPLEALRR